MKRFMALFLLLGGVFQGLAQETFFGEADEFFKAYVKEGKVQYEAIQQNPQKLNSLVNRITQWDGAPESTQKAFYLNAYNVLAIKSVVDHYPVESPTNIDGFFDKIRHVVAEEKLTLDELEKERLYKNWPDPRLHFALVCAADGCPPLKKGAFFPENLDEQLDQHTEKALKDEDFVRFDQNGRRVEVSQIFKWYREDFLKKAGSILGYINKKRNDPLPSDTRVGFYEYDWSLNKAKKN